MTFITKSAAAFAVLALAAATAAQAAEPRGAHITLTAADIQTAGGSPAFQAKVEAAGRSICANQHPNPLALGQRQACRAAIRAEAAEKLAAEQNARLARTELADASQ